MSSYAELQVTSNFSFLRGASHARELVERAKALNLSALAITDRNTLAGIVRGHAAAKQCGLRFIVGARLDFVCGAPSLLCFPTDRAAYGRLTKLLSVGQGRAEKGECTLRYEDALAHGEGQVFVVLAPPSLEGKGVGGKGENIERGFETMHPTLSPHPLTPSPSRRGGFDEWLTRIARDFSGSIYLSASRLYGARDLKRLHRFETLAREADVPLVATGDILYHHPSRRALQDVVTCIREKCTLPEAGFRLEANAERHLKPPYEMTRLFKAHPDAIARTMEIAARCTFSLDELRYEYPDEPVPPGKSPQQHLEDLTWEGAARRYPDKIPDAVREQLKTELAFIAKKNIPQYFLTVHDIVRWARNPEADRDNKKPILCQGRGSAANSAVCFCLGVTAVDPTETKLLFERFLSDDRNEPPDIDVDFEHERREEVIQYIYRRYGRHRAAICATVIHYRQRSAIRDVGKALGLTDDVTAALANTVWGSWGAQKSSPEADDEPSSMPDAHVRQAGLDPENEEVRRAVDLANELLGFPRHLSQHVGGFVLTQNRLDETVPIGNAAMDDRTFIEWDKDDIDELKLMKVDVLALGMLTAISRAFVLMSEHHDRSYSDVADIPKDDAGVYAMLSDADSIGVFQVESRAQMSMLPRLRPEKFYDLVIEVAIVRPGPIQGGMVHPYLRRRNKEEKVEYPSPSPEHGPADELEQILERTLGVPLFQEQAMAIAITAAQFKSHEANGLRRAMATFRGDGNMPKYRELFISNMIKRGYAPDFAERCYSQIEGFGSYGFPESHAASFAKLVYVSAWIKHHFPDVFCAALLNSQPMGFYQPAQLVRDARAHGVEVRAPDVRHSDWDCTLEEVDPPLPLRGGGRGRGEPSRPQDEFASPREPSDAALHPTPLPPPLKGRGRWKAIRLGLRLVDGLHEAEAQKLIAAREVGACEPEEIARKAGLARGVLERIADADAFRSARLDRRAALWRAGGLKGERNVERDAPLFARIAPQADDDALLPEMRLSEHVAEDYRTVGLSLKQHPCAFFRRGLHARGVFQAVELEKDRMRNGQRVRVAGLVLNRQRPGTAKNVMFATLEDETGVANLVVWDQIFQAQRREWMTSAFMLIDGVLQKANDVTHVIANRVTDLTYLLARLREDSEPARLQRSRDFH
ncbi:MAG: error-prone DNA polymerase [Pseudomonadota bacterium]